MKIYIKPEMVVTVYETESILLTSGTGSGLVDDVNYDDVIGE